MDNNGTTQQPRIVVGVDGSPESKQALRWAAQLAQLNGARVEVVSAWQYPVSFRWAAVPYDWSSAPDETALMAVVDEVFDGHRPAGLTVCTREGNPAAVLIDQCRDALMLVVGSRGHDSFSGLRLGSVSARVAERSPVPVLVVRGELDPETALRAPVAAAPAAN